MDGEPKIGKTMKRKTYLLLTTAGKIISSRKGKKV